MTTFSIDRIVRSTRKSIAISLDQDGKLTVRAPQKMPRRDINLFIALKESWISANRDRILEARSTRIDFAVADAIPFMGKTINVGQSADIHKIQFNGTGLLLPASADRGLTVAAFLRTQARAHFGMRVKYFETRLGAKAASVRLSSAKKRWGSCSTRGSINLSWRLIMCEEDLIDYVVAHELTHILQPNHSPLFYRSLEAIMPDHKERRKQLTDKEAFLLAE